MIFLNFSYSLEEKPQIHSMVFLFIVSTFYKYLLSGVEVGKSANIGAQNLLKINWNASHMELWLQGFYLQDKVEKNQPLFPDRMQGMFLGIQLNRTDGGGVKYHPELWEICSTILYDPGAPQAVT